MSYDPGHPWYYYHKGDGKKPLPVESIEPCDWVAMHNGKPDKPPKDLPTALAKAKTALQSSIDRYQNLVTRGVKAVSEFDINVCMSGDAELALGNAPWPPFTTISAMSPAMCAGLSLSCQSQRRRTWPSNVPPQISGLNYDRRSSRSSPVRAVLGRYEFQQNYE